MTNFINWITSEEINLEGYTLFIPSVSVGNVGQLAVDLLISSMKMKKVAVIWHSGIVCCAGGDPMNEIDDENEICTACELFICQERRIAAIQLRSTLHFELALDFLNCLKHELIRLKIQNVIILASSYAHEMHNITLSPFLYLTNDDIINESSGMQLLEVDQSGKYVAHGSGYAIKLYEVLSESIKCTIIIKYTSEGDNRPDATQILKLVLKLLKNELQKFVTPSSWIYGFGNPPPVDIY